MAQQLSVIADHRASYSDPIAFAAGDAITLSDRRDIWDGHQWIWARAPDGKEGWIPDDITERRGDLTVALRDYAAQELTCRVGETMTGLKSTHGWTWCQNAAGESGWVPTRNLRPK